MAAFANEILINGLANDRITSAATYTIHYQVTTVHPCYSLASKSSDLPGYSSVG